MRLVSIVVGLYRFLLSRACCVLLSCVCLLVFVVFCECLCLSFYAVLLVGVDIVFLVRVFKQQQQ